MTFLRVVLAAALIATAATLDGDRCGLTYDDGSHLHSSVVWAAPFYSGGGYCSEAHDAANALLSCDVDLHILQHGDSFNRDFTDRLGDQTLAALKRRTVRAIPRAAVGPATICICHSEPGAWSVPRPNYRTADCPTAGCSYNVGRTMFETDRLPDGWAQRLNQMDELWVPTEFQRQIFVENGVQASKLQVVGEAVDANFFNPASTSAYVIPQSVLQQPAARGSVPVTDDTVVFLSVFKWEPRKAPELLIRSFCEEFSAEDDTLLLILTNAYHSDSQHGDRIATLRREAAESLGRPESSMPRIAVLRENVPQVCETNPLVHVCVCVCVCVYVCVCVCVCVCGPARSL